MSRHPKGKVRYRIPSVLEDPSTAAIARVYATALLDACENLNVQPEEMLEELGSFVDDVLEAFPEFRQVFFSPGLGRSQKLKLIDEVVAGRGSELFTNFLRTLARHDRLELLPIVRTEMQLLHEKRQGKKRVLVTGARPLSNETLEQIKQRLKEVFGFEPIVESNSDPSLLGGVVIRFNSTVFDASLRSRLRQLLVRLSERSLHEIQSRRDRFCHSEGN